MDNSVSAANGEDSSTLTVEERSSLFYPIISSWLAAQMNMQEVSRVEPDTEWRVFGEFFVYIAKDVNEKQWIVMLNTLKKMNYSSVLHATKNLLEVKSYYEKFGKEYQYCQVILISKGREDELLKTINTHTKIKRIFDNKEVKNSVVYLQDGKFIRIVDNYS